MAASVEQERPYQDDSRYYLPVDATEFERLERQHESILALMKGQPIHAPVTKPTKILDVGCGTGAMTVFLAQAFPNAQVYGVDLSPLPQRLATTALKNIQYIQGNIHDLLAKGHEELQQGSFDYIYQRLLFVTSTEWSTYFRNLSGLLKSGGWLECAEGSWRICHANDEHASVPAGGWYDKLRTDAAAQGIDLELGDSLEAYLGSSPLLKHMSTTRYRGELRHKDSEPELWGITKQFPSLLPLMARKICSARRSTEEAEEIVKGIERYINEDWREGDHFAVHVVAAQRMTS